MSTRTAPPTPPAPGQPVERRRIRPVTVVLTVIVLLITTMWIYGWFFAPRDAANRLEDRAWAEAAEAACAPAADAIAELPDARSFDDFDDPAQRAERIQVAEGVTAELRTMVAALRALPAPTVAGDATLVGLWLDDYEAYLVNRDAHVQEWRDGINRPFAEKEDGGAPISLRMDEFARVNDMRSCRVPADLG